MQGGNKQKKRVTKSKSKVTPKRRAPSKAEAKIKKNRVSIKKALKQGISKSKLAKKYKIPPSTFNRWVKELKL